jgi:hypothetical protein
MQAMHVPKQVLLTIGIAASTSLLITVITLHNASPKPTHLSLNESSTTQPTKQSKPTIAITATTTTSATLGISTTNTHTGTSSPTPPAPANNQTPPSNPPKPITPVSASLSDWYTTGVSNVNVGGPECYPNIPCPVQTAKYPQTQYRIFTYSNSSTKQLAYRTRDFYEIDYQTTSYPDSNGHQTVTTSHGTDVKNLNTPKFTCSIDTAP